MRNQWRSATALLPTAPDGNLCGCRPRGACGSTARQTLCIPRACAPACSVADQDLPAGSPRKKKRTVRGGRVSGRPTSLAVALKHTASSCQTVGRMLLGMPDQLSSRSASRFKLGDDSSRPNFSRRSSSLLFSWLLGSGTIFGGGRWRGTRPPAAASSSTAGLGGVPGWCPTVAAVMGD